MFLVRKKKQIKNFCSQKQTLLIANPIYYFYFKSIFLDCECVFTDPCIECVQTNEVPLTYIDHQDIPGDGEDLAAVQTLVFIFDGGP